MTHSSATPPALSRVAYVERRLDGIYPGTTGHAFIANEVLALLNSTYGTSFPAVDVTAVMRRDPVVQYRAAGSSAETQRGRK